MPTSRQIARLYSLARNCALSHADVIAELQALYQVDSTKRLSAVQYEQYTTHLVRYSETLCAGHGLPPQAAAPRPGMFASYGHLSEFADSVRTFGRLWPGQMTEDDALVLSLLLDKFRLYRTRDRKLSQRQLDQFVAKVGRFPVAVFRAAGAEYLAKHTRQPEAYFLGICKGMLRDQSALAAQIHGGLQLV